MKKYTEKQVQEMIAKAVMEETNKIYKDQAEREERDRNSREHEQLWGEIWSLKARINTLEGKLKKRLVEDVPVCSN